MAQTALARLNRWWLFGTLFLLQAYLLRFGIGSYPSNLQEILIFGQVLIFGVRMLSSGLFLKTLRHFLKHWVAVGFILLTVAAVVAVPIIDQTYFIRHLKFLFFALVLVFIFLETLKSDQDRLNGLKVMAYGALAFGLFSAVYNLLGYNVTYDDRLLGPLDSAVYLAFYLTPFLLFFLSDFFEERQKKFQLIFVFLLIILLLATRSMAAIVCTALIFSFYFLKRSKLVKVPRRYKWLLGGILAILLVATFVIKILPSFQTHSTSLGEREEIWVTTYSMLQSPKNFLFGMGYGQFQPHYTLEVENVLGHKPLDFTILQPHNIFLLFWVQYGLLGLIFMLFCFYKVMVQLWHFEKIKEKSARLALLMLFYFFLHGLIDTPFFKNDLLILFILFLEMSLNFSQCLHQTEEEVQKKIITGKVIKEKSKGQEIGFPTINIQPAAIDLPFGVYAAQVYTSQGSYQGALHYGPRKVLDDLKPSLEVHLLDFKGDLYGQEVKVEVLKKIRDTKHFKNMHDLKKKIQHDIKAIRSFFLSGV